MEADVRIRFSGDTLAGLGQPYRKVPTLPTSSLASSISHGDGVQPQSQRRWVWFITTKSCIAASPQQRDSASGDAHGLWLSRKSFCMPRAKREPASAAEHHAPVV